MARIKNFITDIIDADLEAGRHTGTVTRFPPEPNGYLHIGHAKSICLNFGISEQYGGVCHLRYDDTNPLSESTEFVDSIARDIAWLGFEWGEHRYFASDYFEKMYGYAVELIEKGLAYVDTQPLDVIREQRGSVDAPGTPSPHRARSVEENLSLFARMRDGEFPDGACVLRAKIDMSAANMLLRDPVIYRVKHAAHHRAGERWSIYPMYDFAHCLEDAIEHITHSLCTLEFENNRALYDWVLDHVSAPSRPRQIEFARLNLEYTIVSKRKLRLLVEEGMVEGWDDPRMPTISGLRRRGYTPASIRAFAHMVGVTRNDNRTDIGKLEYCVRDDLNHKAPRILAVLDPLKVTITTLSEDAEQTVAADVWPRDVPKDGTRDLRITREIYIERSDFSDDPPRAWRRLKKGGEVRLRHGYIIRCDNVIRDNNGRITELQCSHDPDTLGAEPADGRTVKGVIHWVSASRAVRREVRLYDRLFAVADPQADPDVPFIKHVNPQSLTVVQGWIEPAFADIEPGRHVQFERLGYFFVDPVSTGDGPPVFHRVVTLRDSWAKAENSTGKDDRAAQRRKKKKAKKAHDTAQKQERSEERAALRAQDSSLDTRLSALENDSVGTEDAWAIAQDARVHARYQDVRALVESAAIAARWIVNELPRAVKELDGKDALSAKDLAGLITLIENERVTGAGAREILATLLAEGGDAAEIMHARGLERLDDDDALKTLIASVLAAHPEQAEDFKAGNPKLMGFFIGQIMRQSGGTADAKRVRALLQELVSA